MKKEAKIYASLGLTLLCGMYTTALIFGKLPLDTVSSLVTIIAFIMLILSTKKWTHMIWAGAVYLLTFAFTSSVTVAAASVLMISTVISGAYLLTVGSGFYIGIYLATIPTSYLISLVLTRDYIISLSSLACYPVAICLGLCTRKMQNRKPALIATAASLAASSALIAGIMMIKNNVGLENIKPTIEWIKDSIVKYMSEYKIMTIEGEVNLFKEAEFIHEYIDGLVNIVPGTLIVIFIALAFGLEYTLFSMLKRDMLIEYMTSEVTEIEISGLCAGVYLVAFVLSFTTNSEGNVMLGSVIMQNIYLALSPALVYVACKSIMGFFEKRRMRPGMLLVIPAVLLVMYGLLSVTLCFLGATAIIIASAKQYADKK